MIPAMHLVDLAKVIQTETDERKGSMVLLQFLYFDFRTLFACEACNRIDDKVDREACNAAGEEERLFMCGIPFQDAATANPEFIASLVCHAIA